MVYKEFCAKCSELKTAMENNREINVTEINKLIEFYKSGLFPADELNKWARFIGLLTEYIN